MIGIVGGGLAGNILAKKLSEKNHDIIWFKDDQTAASNISSGIFNPVTGRKYVETWRYEEFLNTSKSFYKQFLKPIVIHKRFVPYNESITANELVEKNQKYLKIINENWIEIKECYQLETLDFITENNKTLQEKIEIFHEKFEYELLEKTSDKWKYKSRIFDKIIFAEGIQSYHNPFLKSIELIPNRGEILTMDIEDFELEYIIKDGKFICNHNGKFWIGSSFERVNITDAIKTEKLYKELLDHIPRLTNDKTVKNIEHLGAFRATTYDRRPVIGEISDHKNIYIFNGFGTKGASLIPTLAEELIENILENKAINQEISVDRFVRRR